MGNAGLAISDADQAISGEEKLKLLGFLRQSHGKDANELKTPKRVTLRRKSVSEIKLGGASGRAKHVSVEVRRKRTYVKRNVAEESDPFEAERAEAARKLEESRREAAQIEEQARQEREQASKRKREAEEAAQREREEKARLEAEAKALQEQQAALVAAEKNAPKQEPAETVEPPADKVAPTLQPAPDAQRKQAPADSGKRKGKGRRGKTDGDRSGRLHVAQGKSGLRKKRPRVRPGLVQGSQKHGFSVPVERKALEITIPESITVSDLAQRMAVKAGEVIKVLMKMGAMVTINQSLDQDTAQLVVEEFGHTPLLQEAADVETRMVKTLAADDDDGEAVTRAPVVTVMGHVDHGKTSLLDHIRRAEVAAGEAGGITQHIGAYTVQTKAGMVTFIDTPGHAAFTAMRARGAQATDIVVLVVAADDGAQPQTVEAIQHARAAEVPIIVAVNKIDKPDADPEKVKTDLSKHEVIPEDWGGDTMFLPVSALNGQGIDELLDAIQLQAELMELKAAVDVPAAGIVVESALDRGRGPVATVLVQKGTLRAGDILLSGQQFGRVRAMFDENGDSVSEAGPSVPVQVLGLSGAPQAGDDAMVLPSERKAREVAEFRRQKHRDTRLAQQQATNLDGLFANMGSGERLDVNLLIKADVQGSVEALRDSLVNLSNDDIKVNVVVAGVGGITESDASLANASRAIIIGFNVRADAKARAIIQDNDLDVRYYSVIYDALDEVKKAILGVLGTETKEKIIGLAEVKDVFRSSRFGAVAGCIVVEGTVRHSEPIRVLRDNVVIYEGELESLRRFKEDVKDVQSGTECGIAVKGYNDVKAGDQIECFERFEVQRTL